MPNKPMRVNDKFYNDVEEIIRQRIIEGKDKIYDRKTPSRITLGITKHPLWEQIKRDAIKAKMEDGRHEHKGI